MKLGTGSQTKSKNIPRSTSLVGLVSAGLRQADDEEYSCRVFYGGGSEFLLSSPAIWSLYQFLASDIRNLRVCSLGVRLCSENLMHCVAMLLCVSWAFWQSEILVKHWSCGLTTVGAKVLASERSLKLRVRRKSLVLSAKPFYTLKHRAFVFFMQRCVVVTNSCALNGIDPRDRRLHFPYAWIKVSKLCLM